MLYLIFDNQNGKIKQIKVSYNEAEKFNQELTDTYDTAGNLVSQTLLNLDNQKFLTLYFDKGVKKGQVIRHNYDRYEIWREGTPEPYELPYSDFLPGYEVEKWKAFVAKNLTYPMAARQSGISGTVFLALLISESGQLLEYEVANEAIMDKNLVNVLTQTDSNYYAGCYIRLWGNPNRIYIRSITGYIPEEHKKTVS